MSESSTIVSTNEQKTFSQGSIILTPTKRMRNGLEKIPALKQNRKEPTHQEIFAWTLSAEATAPCRIRDINQLKESDKGPDFFWLGRVPCRNVKIFGMVMGVSVYETRILYTVDDGTGLMECNHKDDSHKSKKPKTDERPPEMPTPIASVGNFVWVTGRVVPKLRSRQLVVNGIGSCKSANEELHHHQRVEQLHREHYFSSEPFVVPEIKPEPKPSTPRRAAPPTPASVLASSPIAASSPAKSEVLLPSPHRLRHPQRLRSEDLTANTFRIYLKHFMDHDVPPDPSMPCFEDDEDQFARPTPRCRKGPYGHRSPRAKRPSIEPLSLPGLPSRSVVASEVELSPFLGYTISYLRRVPELAFLAKRVLRHEIRRKVRKAREAKGKTASQFTADKLNPSPKEVKRLFTHAIMQLYREGSIVMWTGPQRPLRDVKNGETSILWKADASSSRSVDRTAGNSTTLYGQSKVAITLDLDEDILSDPEPHEESYVSLKIPYLADRIAEIIPQIKASIQRTTKVDTYFGATSEQLAKFLKRDDQWRFVRQDSIDEALVHLEQESRAWCPVKGQWDLTLL